jgi:4-hydroxy-tetrahydrodipicolinate reductase
MGRLVCGEVLAAHDLRLVAAVGRHGPEHGTDVGTLCGRAPAGLTVSELAEGELAAADVVIDFSLPEALEKALPGLGRAALVTGTTGLSEAQRAALDARAEVAPVLAAANFSVGVNLLLGLVRKAAAALPDFDVEIVEAHHRHKIDAPSGTALALGGAVAEARGVDLDALAVHGRKGRTGERPPGQIGFHALRGGDVAGEHTVSLLGTGERLSLSHAASSRAVFAAGAVRAARWVCGRAPGRYHMADVLGL